MPTRDHLPLIRVDHVRWTFRAGHPVGASLLKRIYDPTRGNHPGYFGTYAVLSEVAHPNYMGMMEAYCRIGSELLSADFIDSPTRAEPERISIALSNAEGALDMLASTVERFELMFVPFAKLAAERIRGDDDDNSEAFRNWDKPIR